MLTTIKPVRRGRPVSGAAKSNAQRQKEFRHRQRLADGEMYGKANLNTWLSANVIFALDRLAAFQGSDRQSVLTDLILRADESVIQSLYLDAEAYRNYLKKGQARRAETRRKP